MTVAVKRKELGQQIHSSLLLLGIPFVLAEERLVLAFVILANWAFCYD